MLMRDKGMDTFMDYSDMDFVNQEPLPKKFKFPDMKKYSGTKDPHLHLEQFITHMKTTELTISHIVKQFPLSLEGAPIHWYYSLEPYV